MDRVLLYCLVVVLLPMSALDESIEDITDPRDYTLLSRRIDAVSYIPTS